VKNVKLTSWGKYPPQPQRSQNCHWRSDLPALLNRAEPTTLAYGSGRSYGDVCLAASGTVIQTQALDRLIATDWETGQISAECGIRLKDLLALVIPRGWFLPVVPGTQEVTLGGAIANDVHGKNHHRRGTFGRHLVGLQLLRSDRGLLHCDPKENSELFNATIGGLGLTGIITSATIQLVPLGSSRIQSQTTPFASLAEFFQLSQELDRDFEYTAAWLDCQSAEGRGLFTAGRHDTDDIREVDSSRNWGIPFTLPFSAINRWTLPVMNQTWFWLRHKPGSLRSGGYPSLLFPLDGIANWNRCYGKRGFQQYQCVIPENEAVAAYTELLRLIARSGSGSFLSVLKRCGTLSSPGLMSFPMPGVSLALDFPQGDHLTSLFQTLDNIVSSAGGRLYPAKDAHMSATMFQQCFPAWQTVENLRDPALMSTFWLRVSQREHRA